MTASKEISRPNTQHRLSLASSVPARQSISRAHSSSLGAVNATHRINRRKSSSFAPTVANAAAIEAAVEYAVAEGSTSAMGSHRRSSISKSLLAGLNEGGRPQMLGLHHHESVPEGTALTDGPALASFAALEQKARRRASDGSRLSHKKEKSGASDLKCEHCGKAYKHGSCLSKHLWEHTPQWQLTSKLLISKHQQVQLLEAASVLVAMNQDGPANDSDSSSPAASGSSDPREDIPSSTETTPPPQHDYRDTKRHSNSSSVYSRSYQSVFSSGSAGRENGFSHARHWSTSSNRPTTANTSIAESYPDEDPADLAAAVGLLSCSYRTPKNGPTQLGDVPPVPPLPAKYLDNGKMPQTEVVDIEMDDESNSDYEHHTRHDEADYGVFGKMDA